MEPVVTGLRLPRRDRRRLRQRILQFPLESRLDAYRDVVGKIPRVQHIQKRLAGYKAKSPQTRLEPKPVLVFSNDKLANEQTAKSPELPTISAVDREKGENHFLAWGEAWAPFVGHAKWGHMRRRYDNLGEERKRRTDDDENLRASLGRSNAELRELQGKENDLGPRPQLSHRSRLLLWNTATFVAIVAEGYQFAVPFFNFIGVDPTNLAAALRHNPIGLTLGTVFPLVVSSLLFLLWLWIFDSAQSLWEGERQGQLGQDNCANPLFVSAFGRSTRSHVFYRMVTRGRSNY